MADILRKKKESGFDPKKNRKKLVSGAAATILAAAVLAFVIFFDWDSVNSYSAYNTTSTTYANARVELVKSEDLELDDYDSQLYLGSQEIVVTLLSGDQKGETIELTNYLTKIHSIKVSAGDRIIICVDAPESADPYYTVFGFDRTVSLAALMVCFALVVILVGGLKGVRALLGVAYSLLLVMMFMVQAIYHGFGPVAVTLITVLIASGVSLLLLNGFTRRTAVGVLSTLAGVGATAVLFVIFSGFLNLSGYNTESAETLLMVRDSTGLSIRYLLLAGVLISALGAVMDVSVGLVASLDELITVNPGMKRKELYRSGINIGKDMIGTMSNTLIMAFVGSDLGTLLCLQAYGYSANQLFSSDFLAIEISQGLCATMGVVLTIPIATAVSCLLLVRKDRTAAKAEA